MTAPNSNDRPFAGARVEWYAGHKDDETPRAVVAGGRRFEVSRVLSRERIMSAADGRRREVWRCLLDDGRSVTIELAEGGAASVSVAGPA
jgi:hypothetical protein